MDYGKRNNGNCNFSYKTMVRAHAMNGAAFPHIIKVEYTISGKDYTCKKWIGAGHKVPDKGTTIKVIYCEDKPSKARIEL